MLKQSTIAGHDMNSNLAGLKSEKYVASSHMLGTDRLNQKRKIFKIYTILKRNGIELTIVTKSFLQDKFLVLTSSDLCVNDN